MKLAWLLGQKLSPEQVRAEFQKDLRGEVTVREHKESFSLQSESLVKAVYTALREHSGAGGTAALDGGGGGDALQSVRRALLPTLVCQLAASGNVDEVAELCKQCEAEGQVLSANALSRRTSYATGGGGTGVSGVVGSGSRVGVEDVIFEEAEVEGVEVHEGGVFEAGTGWLMGIGDRFETSVIVGSAQFMSSQCV